MTRLVIFSHFFILLAPCLMGTLWLIASCRSFISCNRQGRSKMMDPLKETAKCRPQGPAVPQKTKPCQSRKICPRRSLTGSTTVPPWKWSKMALEAAMSVIWMRFPVCAPSFLQHVEVYARLRSHRLLLPIVLPDILCDLIRNCKRKHVFCWICGFIYETL